MTRLRFRIGFVALIVAACSPGAVPTGAGPTGGQATAVATLPMATETAAAPTGNPATTEAPATQIAIDVALVLPDTVGGQPLEARASGTQDASFIAGQLGIDLASMNVVEGWVGDLPYVTVVQVPGQDTAELREAVRYSTSPARAAAGIEGTPETVGGKDVMAFSVTSGDTSVTQYFYVVGDAIFIIHPTATAEEAEELLAALP